MMYICLLAVLLLQVMLPSCSCAKKSNRMILRNTMKDFSKLHIKSNDYVRGNRADVSILHEIVIAIPQKNIEHLKELLLQVSDHRSDKYGKYLTYDEIGTLVSNHHATEEVQYWLEKNGATIKSICDHGEFITAEATIGVWENIFDTKFHEYNPVDKSNQQDSDGESSMNVYRKSIYRALSYSLPESVSQHVESIFRLTSIPPTAFTAPISAPLDNNVDSETIINHKKKSTDRPDRKRSDDKLNFKIAAVKSTSADSVVADSELLDAVAAGTFITPEIIRAMYNVTGDGNGFGSQAVYEAVGNTYVPSDLTYFQNYFGVQNTNVSQSYGETPNYSNCLHSSRFKIIYLIRRNVYNLSCCNP